MYTPTGGTGSQRTYETQDLDEERVADNTQELWSGVRCAKTSKSAEQLTIGLHAGQ